MKKHPARAEIIGWENIKGIDHPVAVWSDTCYDCGRPVRRMHGHQKPGASRPVFWHASGKAGPQDPRRQPRSAEWGKAISAGMKAANARRQARQAAPATPVKVSEATPEQKAQWADDFDRIMGQGKYGPDEFEVERARRQFDVRSLKENK